MPSIDQHLEQAKHNEHFFGGIDREAFADWAMTALFYSGLHWIDALLASKNIHPADHLRRDNLVWKTIELRPIAKDYMSLKGKSVNARYDCFPFNRVHVNEAENRHFKAIKAELRKYFP